MIDKHITQLFETFGSIQPTNLLSLTLELMKIVESKYQIGSEKKELVIQTILDHTDDESVREMTENFLPYAIDIIIFLAKHKKVLKTFATKHCGCIS